jgi:hypothetical protein
MTEITGVVVNQNVNIPTYTDAASLPTDGSVLLAHFEPTIGFNPNSTEHPGMVRAPLYFFGGTFSFPVYLSDGSQETLPPGWIAIAGLLTPTT